MTISDSLSRLQIDKARAQGAQFVLSLNPATLVSVELAALAIGKSPFTFRSDLYRRPESLPVVTRRAGRVLIRVQDILDWLNNGPSQPAAAPDPGKRRRGRPTKAEQIARAQAAEGAR